MGNATPRRAERLRADLLFVHQFFENNEEFRRLGLGGFSLRELPRRAKLRKARAERMEADVAEGELEWPEARVTVLHSRPLRLTAHFAAALALGNGRVSSGGDSRVFELPASADGQSSVALSVQSLPFLAAAAEDTLEAELILELKPAGGDGLALFVCFAREGSRLVLQAKLLIREGRLYRVQPVFDDAGASLLAAEDPDRHRLCCVCIESTVNSLILPCRHFVLCFVCARQLQRSAAKCPMCREGIHSFVKLYSK